MSHVAVQFSGREWEPNFDVAAVRRIIADLLVQPVEDVESELVEIKGWCNNEKELADKVSEACACLASTSGGFVVVGVSKERRQISKFSPCPHPNVNRSWLTSAVHNLTKPPVECSAHDVSDLLAEALGIGGNSLFILRVPRTRHISGHVNHKGVSKIRVGKECQPQFVAEDDRTRAAVPELTVDDLLADSVDWAMGHHRAHFRKTTQWTDRSEFLAQAGLLEPYLLDEEHFPRFRVSLACLLLFGKSHALARHCPSFETLVLTNAEPVRLRKNIVESVRELCFGEGATLCSLVPGVPNEVIKELVVNAYAHRCYRTPSPVVIRVSQDGFEIQNPGELLTGLTVGNLIYGIPVYRNMLLADGTRFVGLCDKLGQGIDVVYRDVLSSGLGFPEFESGGNLFTARISLTKNAKFKEFIRKRSGLLSQLDQMIVLQLLWNKGSATLAELCSGMQRREEFAGRVLEEMCTKALVERLREEPQYFTLNPLVRRDIEEIFQDDQMALDLSMWGEPTGE